ncbi:ABC transporter ATP-binding protein [Paenibacillus ginsengarvi]|uniref:ABC transporter ATP-binding protein n=1 Tax=Paenibacillus ginsengarvi TaxID=400777 RepID=A0A3B0CL00_9BACL|nr:ABC transporter ATP-binding protein [Paenibacillus ginsengarvi]RKN84919.1 ABC transporter ATP-binding protein [Paenibacillus ginsengarvi]
MAVIKMNRLTKTFGKQRALDGVDMTVNEGETFGFIGPNGAGKSTAIRITLGLLRKDGGDVRLFGKDPWRDAVELHRRLAYVPGDVSLWPGLTGGETIDLMLRLRGGADPKRRSSLIERFKLDPSKKNRTYSKGNRQKVALIAAFASNSELYILDEPTSGLDPLMEAVFRECVAEAKNRGSAVLLSSHILAEVEELCDRVGIIKAGRIVESGTFAELRHLSRTFFTAELAAPAAGLPDIEGLHDMEVAGSTIRFSVDPNALDRTLRALAAAGVRSLTSRPPTLEELFMRHYDTREPGTDSRNGRDGR